VLSCAAVDESAQPFLAALLRHLLPSRPIVVVTEGLRTQESFHQDLSTWVDIKPTIRGPPPAVRGPLPSPWATSNPSSIVSPAPSVLFFPAWEVLPLDARLPHVDVISERLETLVALLTKSRVPSPRFQVETGGLQGPMPLGSAGHSQERGLRSQDQSSATAPAPIVVTSVPALLQRTFPADVLRQHIRVLTRGQGLDPLDMLEWLEAEGYEPEAQVTQKGEIALRGGIVDVYPLTSSWPVRMEFFGDELESLRYFDPLTQVSREEIASVTIPPAGELGILRQWGGGRAEEGPRTTDHGLQTSDHRPGPRHPGIRSTERPFGSLLDYLPTGTIFLLSEPEQLRKLAEEYSVVVSAQKAFYLSWELFREQASRRGMAIIEAAGADPARGDFRTGPSNEPVGGMPSGNPSSVTLPTSHVPVDAPRFEDLDAFRPMPDCPPEPEVVEAQRRQFFDQLHRWLRHGYAVNVFCNNDGERQRFAEIWKEYGFERQPTPDHGLQAIKHGPEADDTSKQSLGASELRTRIGSLSRGFICEEAKLVVVTDAEIFGRYKVQRPRRLKSPHAQATRSALDIDFTDLEEGDYVVHLQHGIGKYIGLRVLPMGAGTKPTEGANSAANSSQECLVIEYAPAEPSQDPPKLYVPVTEAHLVSKYVGTGKARPLLNSLGGTRWAKAKSQAERAVRDVASELLAIQAARESQPGHAFAPDVPWQREFESAFLFEETPDQMRAILEAKGDMERPKPMDRLICGDVGFGKTEVGIRAAFKAVMDGRQVAVLVPTTVLAQQHFNTFRERMADYPVRIELLSRFRTRRAQQRVVKDLAIGAVDIVIGTHRLLQSDIGFKDLGLVVIDEEQRFGVLHKEKFKRLRRLVDVLTLSATPIPRTLYLALTGARDMSTIQTPPHDRLPVQTIVTQYDERVIRDAIRRELNRGGQVFFLHNRVLTIETMAQKLRALVPDARIVVDHGQMHSDDLAEVMTRFVNGEADILLSTTIIESGLDIPNANTIIIDRADRFGLSDLYQLRGRVGRYKHQAYAYLLLPRHAGLLADVRKRLSAIKQYSTLGSGFKIAMRDLEIRGAGNLLGAQQSGHITAVGFELYCQLLKQSVASLRGVKAKPRIEVQVRLDFLTLSPAEEGRRSKTEKPTQSRGVGHTDLDVVDEVNLAESATAADSPVRHHRTRPTQPAIPTSGSGGSSGPVSASIPFRYISDSRQRIDIYRKLAQATDKSALEGLEKELRDRFGPLPEAIALLLDVAELRILASERSISVIEVKEGKLMLTRDNDYIMVGSKFPRLTSKDAPGRLKEIRELLLAL